MRTPQWIRFSALIAIASLFGVACTGDSGSNSNPGVTGGVIPPAVSPAVVGGGGALEVPDAERREYSASADCKTCHPRQFEEWRTSPHAYSGISPSFYSLVAAGQNSFGAGVLANAPGGVSVGGAVGNFCLPCHAPLAYIGDATYGGNNSGFANVQPDTDMAFVCGVGSANPFMPCTQANAADPAVCNDANACRMFEGRTCSNTPPVTPGTLFPRQMQHCSSDSDCDGGATGPCIINPATIFYTADAQEGINCEVCHNMTPNHNRGCQLFRNSDSVGVLSVNIAERGAANDGRRTRLGPYPLVDPAMSPLLNDGINDGGPNDHLRPVTNAFHESARVDSPMAIPFNQTDRPGGVANVANTNPHIVRPTALSCEDLPYCGNAGASGMPGLSNRSVCNGGFPALIGMACSSDLDCGGCGNFDPNTGLGVCGTGSPFAGNSCVTSNDCNVPSNPTQNLLEIGTADGTLGPLSARPHVGGMPGNELDRSDGNYYRSSMYCGVCHDVRPPFANAVLRSCQLQDTQVCSTDLDCRDLNIGCPGNDCGPCVTENNAAPSIVDGSSPGNTTVPTDQIDPRNNGYRRVENLFTEWQISAYAHPELRFCQNNSFRACSVDADCILAGPGGEDEGPCSIESPLGFGGEVVTCQDCHMSNFPETPLVAYTVTAPTDPYDNPGFSSTDMSSPNRPVRGAVADKNDLYSMDLAAVEGSQTDTSQPLPVRRVSTHFMSGVDLPLVRFPGQSVQATRRQQLVDSGFKIVVESPKNLTTPAPNPIFNAGDKVRIDIEIENVGVGHRYPAGFSHERQNWVQMFVTERSALQNLGNVDPFDVSAPCNLQGTIARSAEDARDPVGATALGLAGCVYRSGFVLDKAHPETGEMAPDGSFDDEDPEDFFVVVGTRVRGDEPNPISATPPPRIEVNPGSEGRALSVVNVCAEATADTYRAAIAANSGIDLRADSSFPFRARICDENLSPAIPGEGFRVGGSLTSQAFGSGVSAPGFGNPDCMVGGDDVGPCVPEIELSDGRERGRCAGDLTRGSCQSDFDCADEGPCLFSCSGFGELMCCDQAGNPDCATFYAGLDMNECFLATEGICVGGTNSGQPCFGDTKCLPGGGLCDLEGSCVGGSNAGQLCLGDSSCPGSTCGDVAICIGGSRSGLGCDSVADCPGTGTTCGDVGPCNVENGGIVNFQNQFRVTNNGVCVDLANPREPDGSPIPVGGNPPVSCFLDLTCTLSGLIDDPTRSVGCLINGQCAENAADGSSFAGDACTNYTYRDDCGNDGSGDPIACNVQFNLELNGRPSESVFIQNHPYNFNSLAPFEPRVFEYEFDIPAVFAGKDLVISARIMNRQFPMRFLRNLVGTQTVNPPLVVEAQGNPDDPNDCNNTRQIDIDCYVKPLAVLGNAEPGGFVPAEQFTRTRTFPVVP